MNHDLFLRRADGAPLVLEDARAFLEESPLLGALLNAEHSTPEQLVLLDPDTSVFALLTEGVTAEEEEEEDGRDGTQLQLQLPYLRPRFFAVQGASFVTTIAAGMGLVIADPGDERAPDFRPRTEDELVASWEASEQELLEELRKEESAQLPEEVPRATLDAFFTHNVRRRALAEDAGPAVEIPRLGIARLPAQRDPVIVARYAAAERLWLPDTATHVVLTRKRKGLFGYKSEEILVDASSLRMLLSPFERPGEAPSGLRAFAPTIPATDPSWANLTGSAARGLALVDPQAAIDA